MRIKVAWIGKTKEPAIQSLTEEYLKRIGHFSPVEGMTVKNEAGLQKVFGGQRNPQFVVLLNPVGRQFSSEEFAEFFEQHQLRSSLPLLFAIGPADGFSESTRKSANMLLSLGKMTYAHEIARIVLLEQIYRALTIIKRHPYHVGH